MCERFIFTDNSFVNIKRSQYMSVTCILHIKSDEKQVSPEYKAQGISSW